MESVTISPQGNIGFLFMRVCVLGGEDEQQELEGIWQKYTTINKLPFTPTLTICSDVTAMPYFIDNYTHFKENNGGKTPTQLSNPSKPLCLCTHLTKNKKD